MHATVTTSAFTAHQKQKRPMGSTLLDVGNVEGRVCSGTWVPLDWLQLGCTLEYSMLACFSSVINDRDDD
jgi:hypothetical protein